MPNPPHSFLAGCRNGYYRSPDGTCILCPSNSNSTSFDDDVCSCNSGTVLVSGGDETTSEPCAGIVLTNFQGSVKMFSSCSGCDAGYFRLDDSCITCPNNTVRESATDDESSCRCVNSNYRRRNLDITMDCLRKCDIFVCIVFEA